MTKTQKPETPMFSAYVMLSEPLQFLSPEIEVALAEDFPGLDLGIAPEPVMPMPCDTDKVVVAPLLVGAAGADARGMTVFMNNMPGSDWQPNPINQIQKLRCPDLDERQARYRSYFAINVSAASNELPDLFRAARLCSCLAAVFSALPVTLAVWWGTARHYISPENTLAMAEMAMRDEWPMLDWLGYGVGPAPAPPGSQGPWVSGTSSGLLPFRGFEFNMVAAPLSFEDGFKYLMALSAMVLENGARFQDGDTIGLEGEDRAQAWRLRHMAADAKINPIPGLAQIVAIHPDSYFDEKKHLGRRRTQPAPPGYDNTKTYGPGLFKRLMGGGR